ncbi:hypothetical protein GCM10011409_38190 [Lentibacillus populi]|uniref:Replication-relaxation n=1 Tax=Lentibacillus populi TaxID=1827502 RepID=A0A9W5U1V5_9BACI|nr:replication-relaxation family protein [Lentibacillus populi]GGB56985.1 hypothetical protein GCM10011409_38190 [Lentibacillus populi]
MMQTQKWIQRQEKILSRLDDLTYATREQLQITEQLGGSRNAHRILFRMEKEKSISSVRMERKVYYLSNKGKERIGSNQGELKRSWITHTLMRNDLYIKLGMPDTWEVERPVTWGNNKLIPDARFTRNGIHHFVEIDNQQTMRTNEDKIKLYKDLSHVIFKQFHHKPVLIWYTLSKVRREKLKEACTKAGVKHVLH